MAGTPSPPQTDAAPSARWKRASLALTVLALVAVIGPIAANVMFASEGESSRKHEEKEEKQATPDEEEEEEEEEEDTPSSSGSIFSSFSGGGSRSGGSRSTSSSDVVACNRAATAARANAKPPQHRGLAKALDAAGGGLLGATAQSLHGVEQQVADDQRAADAFRACMDAAR